MIKLWPLLKIFSAELWELHSMCQWKFSKEFVFWKKKSSFSDIERNFFDVLLKFFWCDCQNYIVRVPGAYWGRVVFFSLNKKYFFPSLQDSEQKNFGLLLKTLRRSCQNSITLVHRNVLVEDFPQKNFFLFFSPFSDEIVACSRNFFSQLVKAAR